jgi:hypothetical protein
LIVAADLDARSPGLDSPAGIRLARILVIGAAC